MDGSLQQNIMVNFDSLWLVMCTMLVLLMQAGFLALESGLTRAKNNINVAIKNLTDFSITTVIFWAFGFALMFGATQGGVFGSTNFLPSAAGLTTETLVFLLFQITFCGTTVTILSGATAERIPFTTYMFVSVVVGGLIYPVFGHWAWNGINLGVNTGWLGVLGFVDFAGSTVVHSMGGWISLALLLIIGPRTGRFPKDGQPRKIQGSNLPLSSLGVILLWVGWFGFNGGSNLAFDETVPLIITNTVLAGSAGLVGAILTSFILNRKVIADYALNGSLAGLVAVTANANAVTLGAALLIGLIAGTLMLFATNLLERYRIDDAVGAIPVHLAGGIWGTLAVGLFADPTLIETGLSRGAQIGVQSLGIGMGFLWGFGVSYTVFWLTNKFLFPMRVSAEKEEIGLNISEHEASSDLLELFGIMESHSRSDDLSLRAPVEPFTEVGQIARRYNSVMEALEVEVNRTASIVNTSADAILTFEPAHYRITSCNPTAEYLFGYPDGDLLGEPIQILFQSQMDTDSETVLNQILNADSYVELVGRRADGSQFALEVAMVSVDTRAERFYTATVRDISIRKQAQEQIEQQNRDLTTTNEELDIQRRKALEAAELKSQFLATMSHELRTPLNSVIGFTQIQLAGMTGELTDEQRNYQERVLSNAKHLLELINQVLDLSKIEAGRMEIAKEPFNLSIWLTTAVDRHRVLAQEKGLELTQSIDPGLPRMLLGDAVRLEQMLVNLIGNAIKFTESGRVEVQILTYGADKWQIKVRDTGIGIPSHQQEVIFEEFRQVDGSTKRKYGGTGLGLTIVRRFTAAMNGTLRVSSKVGQGSTFTITLPMLVPAAIDGMAE